MKAKHTPGPWYDKNSAGNHQGMVISEATGATVAVVYDKRDTRLLAAAPDLLAALQAVHAGFMDGSIKWAKPRRADSDPYHPANTLMSAAIDKATQP